MSQPLRVCFVAYRGSMRCGGQGVYLWFLAPELARQCHEVDAVVGPPYPDAMHFARSVAHQDCGSDVYWRSKYSRLSRD